MRTNLNTHATAITRLLRIIYSVTTSDRYISSFIIQINFNFSITCKIIPVRAKPICNGSEYFISFFTPDNEVYVEEPVKFIARKEEIAVIIKNHENISIISFPARFSGKRIIKTKAPVKKPFQ